MTINKKGFEIALARKCWSRQDLANATGMSLVSINRAVRGETQLSTKNMGRVAKALEVDVVQIIE